MVIVTKLFKNAGTDGEVLGCVGRDGSVICIKYDCDSNHQQLAKLRKLRFKSLPEWGNIHVELVRRLYCSLPGATLFMESFADHLASGHCAYCALKNRQDQTSQAIPKSTMRETV